MEDDETRSNTGDVTAAVFPTATATASKDDPLSSSHQSLLVQAGVRMGIQVIVPRNDRSSEKVTSAMW